MGKKACIVIPNTPHHIIQRGHNKSEVFVSEDDYTYYFDNLNEWKQALGWEIFAYCLMTNHHLIVDPGPDPSAQGFSE
jgi:putative transposase